MEHVNGRKLRRKKEKKKKNKVEEIQLANLASLGSLASKNQCGAWYAEAVGRSGRDKKIGKN